MEEFFFFYKREVKLLFLRSGLFLPTGDREAVTSLVFADKEKLLSKSLSPQMINRLFCPDSQDPSSKCKPFVEEADHGNEPC